MINTITNTTTSNIINSTPIPSKGSLVQWLFASGRTSLLSNSQVIDYSPLLKNASIWQYCYYDNLTFQVSLTNDIVIDWTTDGIKAEWLCSLDPSATQQYVLIKGEVVYGLRIAKTFFILAGKRADGATIESLTFGNITTSATDTMFRYKIVVSGNGANITVFKTSPSDINYTSATSQTVSRGLLVSSTFGKLLAYGRWAYINIGGQKFSFGEGYGQVYYSFNSLNKWTIATSDPAVMHYQNDYLHNVIYGYDVVYDNSGRAINISRDEAGNSNLSSLAILLPENRATELVNTVFYKGYSIKLDQSILPYDQGNTFFDVSNNPKYLTKDKIPSTLNNRIFFNHSNGNDLLVYSSNQNITRSVNTLGKKLLIIGDSTSGDATNWGPMLSLKMGFVRTSTTFSGQRLNDQILVSLQALVASTPTYVSDKDFIILEGGFNDYAQGTTKANFITGVTNLFNYIRSQNPNAIIVCAGLYDFWDSNKNSYTGIANSGGMFTQDIRDQMKYLADHNAKTYYADWNAAGVINSDTDNLHTYRASGGLKLANVMQSVYLNIF
jgi:hypothetical protein